MPGGGREDDEDGAGDELQTAHDFIRTIAGRVALELGTTPEGRAAGLSVEVWPGQGVSLRVRRGHELRIFVAQHGEIPWAHWERLDPDPGGGRPRTSEGNLGEVSRTGAAELQAFMTRWLAWRTDD